MLAKFDDQNGCQFVLNCQSHLSVFDNNYAHDSINGPTHRYIFSFEIFSARKDIFSHPQMMAKSADNKRIYG